MATKYAIETTFTLNNNQTVLEAMRSITAGHSLYNSNLSTWANQYEAYVTSHTWSSNNNIKIKRVENLTNGTGTIVVTTIVEGATADNILALHQMHILESELAEVFLWIEQYFDYSNITKNSQIITVNL